MEVQQRNPPRVVLLNDWQGTIVGLAYGSDGKSKDTRIPVFSMEDRTDFPPQENRHHHHHVGVPRVAGHVLERLRVLARKCIFKTTLEENVEKLFADDLHTREKGACALADLSLTSQDHKIKIVENPRALEGLVKLLHLNSAGMTPHECQCARAQTEATRAFVSLACEQENRWKIAEYPDALMGLVKVLLTNCESEARKWAAQALGNVSTHSREVRLEIGDCPHALAGLVRLVNKDNCVLVREQAARTLGLLMKGQVQENKEKIGRIPHALGGLVRLLSSHEDSGGQKMGALALAKLNYSEEILLEIADTPCALSGLVGLLSSDHHHRHKLDHSTVSTSSHDHYSIHWHHKKQPDDPETLPDKLATLVGVLLNQENATSQKRTARALASLYHIEKPAASASVALGCSRRHATTIEQEKSTEENLDNKVEGLAVNALHFLAAAREKKILMSEYPRVLIGSVGPLPKEESASSSRGGLPVCAFGSMALASLARAYGNRKKIAECGGALAGLVRLLGKTECSVVQAYAACALANVAHGGRQIQYSITRIPNAPDAVASLVGLLVKQRDHPHVQAQAARALACLASVRDRDNNLVIITKFPDVLTVLARLLFQCDIPSVQEEAAWALINIGNRHLGP